MKFFIKCMLIIFPLMSTTSWAEKSTPISGKLENGLRYTILPLHQQKNRLDIRVKVHAGAVDEQTHQAGIAHMVEHMVFRATKDYPQGIMPYLHDHQWIRAKHYNAVTTHDSTTYMFVPPPQFGLKNTLNVIHQMLFQAQFKTEDLEKERQIILEEWRGNQGVASRMNLQRTQSVRINSRYAHHQPIGTADNIQQLPANELQHFYQTWYVPNNIHLMIIGDINIDDAKHLIEQQFGNIPSQKLAERDYYDPILEQKIRFHQLHDEQSGVSQIAYIFRFDESQHRLNTEQARKQRLIDRIALEWISHRLKNQQNSEPQHVKNIAIRKSDIGKNTVALGLFASVQQLAHRDALKQIFLEIKRIQHYPITYDELQKLKLPIQQQLDKAKQHQEDRDFEAWVQVMNNTLFADKPYLTQAEIAQHLQPMLDEINPHDIQQRVAQWLNSPDRIVQYQAPNKNKVIDINLEEFQQLQQQITQQHIAPPQTKPHIEAMELSPSRIAKGQIISKKYDKNLHIYQWQLSNGDTVVWLKSPIAQDKTYLQAISLAGFQRQDLNRWQAQIATQIIKQKPPTGWTDEQFSDWKKRYRVNYSMEHDAQWFKFIANAPTSELHQLFNIYSHLQNVHLDTQDISEIKQTVHTSHQQNQQYLTQQQIAQLRFANPSQDILPTADELKQLNTDRLSQQWYKIQSTPTVYYIINNADEKTMQQLILQYLTPISRQKSHQKIQQTSHKIGREILSLPSHQENKYDVQMWFSSPHRWQTQDAMLVSLLQSIASQKLKQVLRDEQLGVYRLQFESRLNPDTHYIESELKFTTSAEKLQQMIEHSEQILAKLPTLIDESDVIYAQKIFQQQEQERLKSAETWLNRLILSHQHDDDGCYLQLMSSMKQSITREQLQTIAQKLYQKQYVKIFIKTPVEISQQSQ